MVLWEEARVLMGRRSDGERVFYDRFGWSSDWRFGPA